MDIGEKIKNLRISMRLTQEELATAAGTKKQTIHKYETGIISNIPASKIKLIADKLETTPAYLMGWENESNQKQPTEGELSDMHKLVMQKVEGMNEIQLKKFLQVLELLDNEQ